MIEKRRRQLRELGWEDEEEETTREDPEMVEIFSRKRRRGEIIGAAAGETQRRGGFWAGLTQMLTLGCSER